MPSRSAYTATTPLEEYANFPTPHSLIPAGLNPSSSRLRSEEHDDTYTLPESVGEEGSISLRIHSWLTSAKDVMQRNTGLLLFVASQAFIAFMDLAVKISNTIDPPITALEVCSLSIFSELFIDLMIFSL